MTEKTESVFELGDFPLVSGKTLPQARLAYVTHGQLNDARDNVILYPTWYAGKQEGNAAFVGAGKALDPARYFIVVTNMFGNGASSSPSNTGAPFDRARFPLITTFDNVNAQHRLLFEHLGVKKLALAIGFSTSGQQAFQWAAHHPELVERMACICGSSKTSAHTWLFLEGLKRALTADTVWADGDYETPPEAGLRAFATVYAGLIGSQDFYREDLHLGFVGQELKSTPEFLDLVHAIIGYAFDANDILAMLATWQATDIGNHPRFGGSQTRALESITARACLMPSTRDLLFPLADNEREVAAMSNATLAPIDSAWGHFAGHPAIATGADLDFIDTKVRELLES